MPVYDMKDKKGSLMEDAFIGRQAILDLQKSVYAYEILFRSGLKNAFDPNLDGNVATQSVMVNAMLNFGMKKLVSNRKAFINFTEKNLLTALSWRYLRRCSRPPRFSRPYVT